MRDRANWEAWKAGRKPKEVAMSDYLAKVKQLLEATTPSLAYATLSHLALCSTIPLFHSKLRCMRMSSF
ncbi:unnamed protein product [Musa acuminata var. zebrina]